MELYLYRLFMPFGMYVDNITPQYLELGWDDWWIVLQTAVVAYLRCARD